MVSEETTNIFLSSEKNLIPVIDSRVSIVMDDPIDEENNEIIFFVRYDYLVRKAAGYAGELCSTKHYNPRPSSGEIFDLFNCYGQVHHVDYPDYKNYAFVFISNIDYRQTLSIISQIKRNMTPNNRFHINFAGSTAKGKSINSMYHNRNQYRQPRKKRIASVEVQHKPRNNYAQYYNLSFNQIKKI
jgi:hypothetical protein